MPSLTCLTVRQPFATAIFHGKDIENRAGSFVRHFRGLLGIHSAKTCTQSYFSQAAQLVDIVMEYEKKPFRVPPMSELNFGCILGTVEVVDVIEIKTIFTSPWFQVRYGLVLSNPTLYETPIPYKGSLGFWTYSF